MIDETLISSLGVMDAEAEAMLTSMTPVGRLGTVDDVAGLVDYLVSDAAGFLTGQTIVIDGGLTIVSPLNRLQPAAPDEPGQGHGPDDSREPRQGAHA